MKNSQKFIGPKIFIYINCTLSTISLETIMLRFFFSRIEFYSNVFHCRNIFLVFVIGGKGNGVECGGRGEYARGRRGG